MEISHWISLCVNALWKNNRFGKNESNVKGRGRAQFIHNIWQVFLWALNLAAKLRERHSTESPSFWSPCVQTLDQTYLADVDQLRVLPGRCAVCREDGGSVAIGIAVDDVDCVLQGVGLHAAQDGAEYLLRVTLHVRLKTWDKQHGFIVW